MSLLSKIRIPSNLALQKPSVIFEKQFTRVKEVEGFFRTAAYHEPYYTGTPVYTDAILAHVYRFGVIILLLYIFS